MTAQHKYRYPGARPFEFSQHDIFFGREEDVDNLYKLVNVQKLVVLHSKSGLGKSSLINAGLLTRISEKGRYDGLVIRLGPYPNPGKETPVDIALSAVRGEGNNGNEEQKEGNKYHSLWYQLKLYSRSNEGKGIVLIFDQFEEIFTYPDREILEFKQNIARIISGTPPAWVRAAWRKGSDSETSQQELEWLYRPLNP